MAKMTTDQFSTKYSELINDNDDLLIELMEDFSDSISNEESEELSELRTELEKARNDLTELKEKYKQRFMKALSTEDEKDEILEEKEDKIIDIKEI